MKKLAMHQSVATIDSPEFINLQPLDRNPMMSQCEIKVLYIGENRNATFISKEVASEMAKTLRGAPIVGYYKEEKEDFADHGQKVIIDDEGIKFECMTKPYGFVDPSSDVWFQKFIDTDEFGNEIEREYLMAKGFLWTGQYEECKLAVEQGRPQSMELDSETMQGHWATNSKSGMDFFIINDAIFSKLCILGEDVEPCFEGASITAPNVSDSYTLVNNDFKNTLYTMMRELRYALEGGEKMDLEEKEDITVVEQPEENQEIIDKNEQSEYEKNEENIEEETTDNNTEEVTETEEENKEEVTEPVEEQDYQALEKEYNELKDKYSVLETQYNELVKYKENIESKEKDELIDSFYMLSDEDKADVIANKAIYSLDDIESKLSVICVRKKVNFAETAKEDVSKKADKILTYDLHTENDNSNIPAWVAEARKVKEAKQ